jgi:hypothetical protein
VSGLFRTKEPSGVWWRDHSLSLVITAILAVQTSYCLWAGWAVFVADQQAHGELVQGFWSAPFWQWWGFEYQVSLVADTYGVLLIVLLSKWLREVGSSEDSGSSNPRGRN